MRVQRLMVRVSRFKLKKTGVRQDKGSPLVWELPSGWATTGCSWWSTEALSEALLSPLLWPLYFVKSAERSWWTEQQAQMCLGNQMAFTIFQNTWRASVSGGQRTELRYGEETENKTSLPLTLLVTETSKSGGSLLQRTIQDRPLMFLLICFHVPNTEVVWFYYKQRGCCCFVTSLLNRGSLLLISFEGSSPLPLEELFLLSYHHCSSVDNDTMWEQFL